MLVLATVVPRVGTRGAAPSLVHRCAGACAGVEAGPGAGWLMGGTSAVGWTGESRPEQVSGPVRGGVRG